MLYYLFQYLENEHQIPGASLFSFLTFRASFAIILSLLISTIFGKRVIKFLEKKQVKESIRDLGLAGENKKVGTPTMGGLIIIFSTLIPVGLLAKLDNIKRWSHSAFQFQRLFVHCARAICWVRQTK